MARRFSKRRLFESLGYDPHPGQIAVHRSRADRRVVACGTRWGKTMAASMEAVSAALAPADYSVGWCVAPTYDLASRVFREVVRIVHQNMKHRVISLRANDHKLVIRNVAGGESEIRAKSAENPVSLLGEGLDWLIVDEAARLRPTIWQSYLSQRLIDKQGWALLISTPCGRNSFHDMWLRGQRNEPGFASWNAPSWQNPHLDRERIEAERSLLPQRVFAQEYEAAFLDGAGQVFRRVREAATGDWRAPQADVDYIGGLDLAKVADFTVLTILDPEGRMVHMDRFHKLDWSIQVGRIRTSCDRYGSCPVLVDSTGVGEPVLESLCKEGVRATGYTLSQRSKADLIDNLSLMLEQDRLVLPRADLCPELLDELEAFQFSVSDSGNVRSGAPSGQHDDTVISLALAAWQLRKGPAVGFLPTYGKLKESEEDEFRTAADYWNASGESLPGPVGRGLMGTF